MVMNPIDAVSAYKKSGGLFDASSDMSPTTTAGGGDFGSMVKGFLGDAVSSLQSGEAKATSSTISGKTDITSVVTAMDNAEIALTEITTIRDKVISAYQTITSSAI
jgi:flagellar hook-basal body complex protein FliE